MFDCDVSRCPDPNQQPTGSLYKLGEQELCTGSSRYLPNNTHAPYIKAFKSGNHADVESIPYMNYHVFSFSHLEAT